ncbi:TetR/AcrR family transcriptional regulator [Thermomonospora cellulosilytica]|uniref:DNA-binding transcriptional regulator YbjK n=1 Tax=Thermomonospora cellulosilytica TaxID=1411118 RepID=A0A7W3N2B7_9ACTN|nr:TetR/AcrR family transcriptional regulator [Thermomonospora cellulosilytica]MBA9006278.1 DNA-binding transcriptional regulator YbjK [Thermomonospora cellulosilytica]
MDEQPDRRRRLADAAISTLAREGMRGLTHRAVDRAAGVPEGSTSYYFRTRQALLRAAVERLAELDTVEELPEPAGRPDVAAIADAAAGLVELWATTARDRMLARYELALEANRRPELRAVYDTVGARYRRLAAGMLTALGATDPQRQAVLLVACLDGLLFDRLAGAGGAPGRAETAAVLRGLLESFLPDLKE